MRTYSFREEGESFTVEASSRAVARKRAVAELQASYRTTANVSGRPVFCDLYEIVRGIPDFLKTVQVDPEGPPCVTEAHAWEEVKGSLRGHGPGVTYTERCDHCNATRHTDTYGQRRDNGRQGYLIVTYVQED